MNGNIDQWRRGGLILPALHTGDPAEAEPPAGPPRTVGRPTPFARGGIIVPPGSGGDDRVPFRIDGRIYVAPVEDDLTDSTEGWIEGAVWAQISTAFAGLRVEVPPAASGEEIVAAVNALMDLAGLTPTGRPAIPIEDQIDRATAGLCPCGAAPRGPSDELPQGSMYCSYDCEPNHIAEHTDLRERGPLATPARWRPDLITTVDDTGLMSLLPRQPRGRFWAEVFERTGTDRLHLRLDDGVRFAGIDIPCGEGPEHDARCARKWASLERELTDIRATRPAPDLDEQVARWREFFGQGLTSREAVSSEQWMAGAWAGRSDHMHWAFSPSGLPQVSAALNRATGRLRRMIDAAAAARAWWAFRGAGTAPEHPRERALRLRRERNTGPQGRHRAPRRIDARGSR